MDTAVLHLREGDRDKAEADLREVRELLFAAISGPSCEPEQRDGLPEGGGGT